jgi:hypothetical protein
MANQTWKPIAGGICSIVGGVIGVLGGFAVSALGLLRLGGLPGIWGMWGWNGHMMPWGMGLLAWFALPLLIMGVVAIIGGIYSIQRRHWGLALAGAICATLTPMSLVLGVPAIVFIGLARDEFEK